MFSRGTMPYVSAFISLAIVSFLIGIKIASIALLFFTSLFLFLNRDPSRTPEGDGIVSPADGRIAEANLRRIAIFMNHYDVHVNRSPLDGFVKDVKYIKGSHYPAYWKNTGKNERNEILIETTDGVVQVTQIAGTVARRIVSYVKPGDHVNRSDRIGLIRLGSRVEMTIPDNYETLVKINDKVRAGETIIAVERK